MGDAEGSVLAAPSELGNPHRTRLPTFPQQRRLRRPNLTKLPNPPKSRGLSDSRAEPEKESFVKRGPEMGSPGKVGGLECILGAGHGVKGWSAFNEESLRGNVVNVHVAIPYTTRRKHPMETGNADRPAAKTRSMTGNGGQHQT